MDARDYFEATLSRFMAQDLKIAIVDDVDIVTPMVKYVEQEWPGMLPNHKVRQITVARVLEYTRKNRRDLYGVIMETKNGLDWLEKNINTLHNYAQ